MRQVHYSQLIVKTSVIVFICDYKHLLLFIMYSSPASCSVCVQRSSIPPISIKRLTYGDSLIIDISKRLQQLLEEPKDDRDINYLPDILNSMVNIVSEIFVSAKVLDINEGLFVLMGGTQDDKINSAYVNSYHFTYQKCDTSILVHKFGINKYLSHVEDCANEYLNNFKTSFEDMADRLSELDLDKKIEICIVVPGPVDLYANFKKVIFERSCVPLSTKTKSGVYKKVVEDVWSNQNYYFRFLLEMENIVKALSGKYEFISYVSSLDYLRSESEKRRVNLEKKENWENGTVNLYAWGLCREGGIIPNSIVLEKCTNDAYKRVKILYKKCENYICKQINAKNLEKVEALRQRLNRKTSDESDETSVEEYKAKKRLRSSESEDSNENNTQWSECTERSVETMNFSEKQKSDSVNIDKAITEPLEACAMGERSEQSNSNANITKALQSSELRVMELQNCSDESLVNLIRNMRRDIEQGIVRISLQDSRKN